MRVCVYMHVCVQQRPDEEVVVDQGGTSSVMNIHYEKEELEGEYRVKHYSKGHSGATWTAVCDSVPKFKILIYEEWFLFTITYYFCFIYHDEIECTYPHFSFFFVCLAIHLTLQVLNAIVSCTVCQWYTHKTKDWKLEGLCYYHYFGHYCLVNPTLKFIGSNFPQC